MRRGLRHEHRGNRQQNRRKHISHGYSIKKGKDKKHILIIIWQPQGGSGPYRHAAWSANYCTDIAPLKVFGGGVSELSIEPVAKPLVLQLAGGAKLRPTEDRLVRRGSNAANAALELSPHLAGLMASA
jgi:hypothetical protein